MTGGGGRLEDRRFLTGAGRYTDDIAVDGAAHGCVLRSPHAHGRILSIDASAARAAPGVLAVLTAEELRADGLGPIHSPIDITNSDGSAYANPGRPILCADRVRFVGDAVAFVVAETALQAQDAVELIDVDIEPLPHAVDPVAAMAADATPLYDGVEANRCFDWTIGDAAATDRTFADAAHVVRLDLVNNRLSPNSLEPRVAIGSYDSTDGRYTLRTPCQGVHMVRAPLAEQVLRIPPDRLRVLTSDVGGGFGMKLFPYPEHALVLWAARRLGRPVRWCSDRAEAFLGDAHCRDHVTQAELALGADGRFLGLRVHTLANLGAALSYFGPSIPTRGYSKVMASIYRWTAMHLSVEGVFTNTAPVDAYRGAGKPEAIYVVERLIDAAAFDLGLDPAELRRRNMLRPADLPHTTPFGFSIDSGDFPGLLDAALKRVDRAGFAARREASAARGRRRGFGLAFYVHATGGNAGETSRIEIGAAGVVRAFTGTQSGGQGHETVFAELIAERLGVPVSAVEVSQGDSDALPRGGGTGGSSSAIISGNTLLLAGDAAIAVGRDQAAEQLEVAAEDLEFADGAYHVAGTDRRIELLAVAKAAPIRGEADFATDNESYPNGCQICEVEIDPETGHVEIMRYTSLDDIGRMLRPALVAGQLQGGIVQGIGQALMEQAVYDPESGQLLTGSFMDYCLARADDLPAFDSDFLPVATQRNPLGLKGVGECGTIGAPPAVIGAVADALGLRHIDMPATPERVWRALRHR